VVPLRGVGHFRRPRLDLLPRVVDQVDGAYRLEKEPYDLGGVLGPIIPDHYVLRRHPGHPTTLEEFGELRERWTRLHAARNALNVTGLVFACLGALSEARATKIP